MATLVLSTVGSAVGGALGGPMGSMIGQTIGSLVGGAIDQHVFGPSSQSTGPRLSSLDMQTSTEGSPIPLTFGRTRLTGQVIWATNYEEVATTTSNSTGGKGSGPQHKSTTYSYFANFAIGLCEGPIAGIGRVWVDGKALDLNTITLRVHTGSADQTVDPLIASKEDVAPAFQGTAYVVFERLPLEDYGNRLPQLSFEVLRPLDGLESRVRAVTMIPGATEFGYDPEPVVRTTSPGTTEPENTHDPAAATDWHASLDQLQALCPNLERVALVVSWFGTSLDAANCQIEPRVENTSKVTSTSWSAAGLSRANANAVSQYAGAAAYGSTPSDGSVVAAIKDLRARGLKVTLLPFVMMDVPQDNSLINPWTGSSPQPAYPWRGEITVSPAPGQPATLDATAQAATAINAFVGTSTPTTSEWSFRRFMLHMADLVTQAGGVDAFIMGSEMRGLTRVRDDQGQYPFVDALVSLAADLRSALGQGTVLTYGADWSEFHSHQPDDGSGDLVFHLDPLWASSDIDVIGIDQYQPITDWRYEPGHLDEALGDGPHDPAVIRAGLTGGENYDWYYASESDRASQTRTPISDPAHGEPWVYRSKDLVSWWSNDHHNRIGGVRQAMSTAWVPQSKPIWLTEFGAPAVDLAGNGPSAFPSDKPDNDSLPFGARGIRDDAQQRAILDTALAHWEQEDTAFNPLSTIDGRAMLDPSGVHLWTWDARPYPIFPYATAIWSDGPNWTRGHWLNGRLGSVSLAALLDALCVHFDLPLMDTAGLHGVVEGYVVSEPSAPRSLFDDLSAVFALDMSPSLPICKARMRGSTPLLTCDADTLVWQDQEHLSVGTQADTEKLPRQVTLGFSSLAHDHQTGIVRSSRDAHATGADTFRTSAASLNPAHATQIVERMRQELGVAALTYQFRLPPSLRALEPGDTIDLQAKANGPTVRLCIDRIIDGAHRTVEAHRVDPLLYSPAPLEAYQAPITLRPTFGPPDMVLLDLPSDDTETGTSHNVKIAAFAKPWPGSLAVTVGDSASGFADVQTLATPATLGTLAEDMAGGPVAIPHRGGSMLVDVPSGSVSSITQDALMAGGNLAALVDGDELEIIQFQTAFLEAEGQYRLSGLLRGLGGTEASAQTLTPVGTRFVLLDSNVVTLERSTQQVVNETIVRVEPTNGGVGSFSRTEQTYQAVPRSLQPLAPVHLRAVPVSADGWQISWVRRTRGLTDDWTLTTVPLKEEQEAYRVEVLVDGALKREAETSSPSWHYTDILHGEDGAPTTFTLSIRQLGTGGRFGQTSSIVMANT